MFWCILFCLFCFVLLMLLIFVTVTEVCGDHWFHCGSACFNFELICDGWRQCIPTNDEECSEFIDKHNLQHIILTYICRGKKMNIILWWRQLTMWTGQFNSLFWSMYRGDLLRTCVCWILFFVVNKVQPSLQELFNLFIS